MRKINLILVAAMLLVSGSIFAIDGKDSNKPAKKLTTQIADLLKENSIIVGDQDLTATVFFTLNEDKEIVVLSVKTDDEKIEQFVKGKLNYQKVSLEDYREGRTYKVPVRIAL
tara:strand:+ start:81462 stop:81800 length:339 start_codon:yes stop_codon:yes gene_type:complete